MKQLTALGSEALEQLCKDSGQDESAAVSALLMALPEGQRFEVDCAIGSYVVAVRDAAFLAGLAVGKDPLALLVTKE
ncbi:MAG: hypothetical protein KJZ86_13720 [Caldilineaceae bacterium]|nr:hypothetical protein [Caldilineaceae bacterium]HRJ40770.1 hypothetical protein [Caldilineaceae bacterium]